MKPIEHVLQEFIDAIYAADNESDFERVATRVTQRLGFRWFAYLRITDNAPALISSYPKSWTSRYFASRYQQLDPVVRRARLEYDSFSWSGGASKSVGTREQRKFFDEAVTFGIKYVIQLVGLYFHTHATTKLDSGSISPAAGDVLTQRERQCLMWASRGKTSVDIAVLVDVAPRTVVFHLENARRKLGANSIAQCVAEALRRGLLQ